MPFETIALDFIVKLPSQGFYSILTITDQGCTKVAIFIPCNEDITAEETAALILSTYSLTLDYQLKSLVIETHASCPSSYKLRVKSQG
jgi:hypothetical protein